MQVFQETLDRTLGNADNVDTYWRAFTHHLPTVAAPILHERDLYMAWTLKRSKAVNGASCVVGVMGAMHLRGVYYAILNDTSSCGSGDSTYVSGNSSGGGVSCGHELSYKALVASWGTKEERDARVIRYLVDVTAWCVALSLLSYAGTWTVMYGAAVVSTALAQ